MCCGVRRSVPVAPKAHDMAREYNVLGAVHPFFPQAPRVFLLCEDPGVIGAIFFIMERRRGLGAAPRTSRRIRAAIPISARRVSEAFVDCLAALHAVDVNRVMLGKPAGFLERQVSGWAERFARAQTETLPQMDQLIALAARTACRHRPRPRWCITITSSTT